MQKVGKEEEKKEGVGFGVSLKKVGGKKDSKEGGIELPKLKKIGGQKGGDKDAKDKDKPAFALKKVNRGE